MQGGTVQRGLALAQKSDLLGLGPTTGCLQPVRIARHVRECEHSGIIPPAFLVPARPDSSGGCPDTLSTSCNPLSCSLVLQACECSTLQLNLNDETSFVQGRLTLVLGPPGSGKSAFLAAMAGHVSHDRMQGSIAYIPAFGSYSTTPGIAFVPQRSDKQPNVIAGESLKHTDAADPGNGAASSAKVNAAPAPAQALTAPPVFSVEPDEDTTALQQCAAPPGPATVEGRIGSRPETDADAMSCNPQAALVHTAAGRDVGNDVAGSKTSILSESVDLLLPPSALRASGFSARQTQLSQPGSNPAAQSKEHEPRSQVSSDAAAPGSNAQVLSLHGCSAAASSLHSQSPPLSARPIGRHRSHADVCIMAQHRC